MKELLIDSMKSDLSTIKFAATTSASADVIERADLSHVIYR
jgi:hypothetical protein